MGRVTERNVNMVISTKKLYKKHMKTATCKSKALQLSMEELTDIYDNKYVDLQMLERYEMLKTQNFQLYTILPQVLISIVAGLGTGASIIALQTSAFAGAIVGSAILILCIAFMFIYTMCNFKSSIQILIEYEIYLIERKIKCDVCKEKEESKSETT